MTPGRRRLWIKTIGGSVDVCRVSGSTADVAATNDGVYAFFRRARWLNILGQGGASISVVALAWDTADRPRLLLYLAIHQVLLIAMGVSFVSRWTTSRLDSGIPRFAPIGLVIAQGWCGSALLLDLESAESRLFALQAMIVMFACAAGTMVTLGPIKRLSRLALVSLLGPGTLACFIVGHYPLALGTVFFLAVVGVVGVSELDQTFHELIRLRVESNRAASQAGHAARHDPLTGLVNRAGIAEVFETGADRFEALLYIDLDRFKQVNDQAGHGAGDELLQRVGQRLRQLSLPGDLVGRLGGDEFVMLIEAGHGENRGYDTAKAIVGSLEEPFGLRSGRHRVSASVGIAEIRRGASLPGTIRRADAAMFEAKNAGRGQALWFTDELENELRRTVEIEHELHRILAADAVEVFGQPIFSLEAGEIVVVELLSRPQFRPGLEISPQRFIEVAERLGMVDELTRIVLRRAATALVEWRTHPDLQSVKVAVNVSASSLTEWLVDEVDALAVEFGIEPSGLLFEVTESLLVSEVEQSSETLAHLRQMGITVALDDFGTGYSSLTEMLRLPLSYVKIDKSLVQGVGTSEFELMGAIVDIAVKLGHETVAEGVETLEQLYAAGAAGASLIQGNLLAAAAPLAQVEAALGALARALPFPIAAGQDRVGSTG